MGVNSSDSKNLNLFVFLIRGPTPSVPQLSIETDSEFIKLLNNSPKIDVESLSVVCNADRTAGPADDESPRCAHVDRNKFRFESLSKTIPYEL